MIRSLRPSGSLTFRPVGGNRLRCNQHPEWGHISAKQAETRRKVVAPKRQRPNNSRKEVKSVSLGRFEDQVNCPHCHEPQASFYEHGALNNCSNCRGRFHVQRRHLPRW